MANKMATMQGCCCGAANVSLADCDDLFVWLQTFSQASVDFTAIEDPFNTGCADCDLFSGSYILDFEAYFPGDRVQFLYTFPATIFACTATYDTLRLYFFCSGSTITIVLGAGIVSGGGNEFGEVAISLPTDSDTVLAALIAAITPTDCIVDAPTPFTLIV